MRLMGWIGAGLLVAGSLAVGARAAEEAVEKGPASWDEVPVQTLRDAAKAGKLRVKGTQPKSYRAVTLTLGNKTQARLSIDFAGSHLDPRRRGSCQRLGLGPAITPSSAIQRGPGTQVVNLEPGEERTLDVNTCCLDAGKAAPTSQTFVASAKKLPEVREKVLRWWADNPTAPQGAVNSAIWSFRDTVHVSPGVVRNFTVPEGLFAAVHAGHYYQLRDGELTVLDPEGIRRFLGTEIFQVLPADGAVYAVALGDDRKPDLWRHAMTGENPWAFVMDVDGTNRIHSVLPAGGGNLVFVTDKGIDFFVKETGETKRSLSTEQIEHLSVRRRGDRHLTVTVQRPPKAPVYRSGEPSHERSAVFELWNVELATGKAERVKEYWTVKGMLAGPAGVFALSHRGKLERLKGDSFKDFGGKAEYARILAVGETVLWLEDGRGRAVTVDGRTGRRIHRTDLRLEDRSAFDIDPRTGDLAIVQGGAFQRIRAEDGSTETLESTE